MSRRNKEEMAEIADKVVGLIIANETLSDDDVAKHYGVSSGTVAKIRRERHAEIEGRVGVEDGVEPTIPSWVEKHSVNCYFCNKLFDEREGYPADEMNGGDGGTACQKCYNDRHDHPEEKNKNNALEKEKALVRAIEHSDEDFTAHIVLYSKGHYGHGSSIIEDLKILLCKYAGLDRASTTDIWQLLCESFARYVTNEFDIAEGMMEALGKKWIGFNERWNREPEEVIIGKLSVIDGRYCYPEIKMDIKLEPPRQNTSEVCSDCRVPKAVVD